MKISIVTVVYNGAATIASAIESVIAQDHPDIEYIVIDGLSKDNTVEIVKSYGDKVSILVSEKDKGIFDAMNKGVGMATGDVIGILNADDYYASPTVLSTVARELERSGADSVFGDLVYVNPDRLDKVVRYYDASGFKLSRFEKGDMPPHPTFFVRRAAYERFGNFDPQFRIVSDYDLMLRFLYIGKLSWVHVPMVMVTMRTGGNSDKGLQTKIKLNREVLLSLKKNGVRSSRWRVYSKYFKKVFQLVRRPKR